MNAILYAVVALVNCVAMALLERGSAINNSDPVVVVFALYGLIHIEWLMLRATLPLHRRAVELVR